MYTILDIVPWVGAFIFLSLITLMIILIIKDRKNLEIEWKPILTILGGVGLPVTLVALFPSVAIGVFKVIGGVIAIPLALVGGLLVLCAPVLFWFCIGYVIGDNLFGQSAYEREKRAFKDAMRELDDYL